MATLNIEGILDRVSELKRDNDEKDEVIRAQQVQITELETKSETLDAHIRDLDQKIVTLTESAAKADELIEKLNDLLG